MAYMQARGATASGDAAEAWALLAEDGARRDADGRAKYGVSHQADNGRDHAVDAYQELLDACCYWAAEAGYSATGDGAEAFAVYEAVVALAHWARLYLLRRDGR